MRRFTIIWDFDGTILPLAPFDSEQSLLIHRMSQREKPFGWFKKAYARAVISADRREWFRKTFKKRIFLPSFLFYKIDSGNIEYHPKRCKIAFNGKKNA